MGDSARTRGSLNGGARTAWWLCGILGAIIVTAAGSWWAYGGRNYATKADLAEHITRAEMDMLMRRIDEMATDIREIRAALTSA